MEYLLLLLAIFLVALYVAWAVQLRAIKSLKKELEMAECEIIEITEMVSGLYGYNEKQATKKEKKKELILEELDRKRTLQVNEVMVLIESSRSTAYRYLEELEQAGLIKQVGAFGRSVTYKLTR